MPCSCYWVCDHSPLSPIPVGQAALTFREIQHWEAARRFAVNLATARINGSVRSRGKAQMPNGGSDCCGTCWFNAKNKGQAGYDQADDPEPDFCTIRGLPIEYPFYTYCGNHPHRRPERDPIPIGPVFTGDSSGAREFWKPSPDTEEVREHLLTLLEGIEVRPGSEYPIGLYADEVVVWQLGEFRETRAIDGLRRIALFQRDSVETGPFGRTREDLVRLAREALDKIEQDPA